MVWSPRDQHNEQWGADRPPDRPVVEKSWDQYEQCDVCHGRAEIDETLDGDLVCHVCRAMLPRPAT